MTILIAAVCALLTLLFPGSLRAPAADCCPVAGVAVPEPGIADPLVGVWDATFHDDETSASVAFVVEATREADGTRRVVLRAGSAPPVPLDVLDEGTSVAFAASSPVELGEGRRAELAGRAREGRIRGTLHLPRERALLPWSAVRRDG